MPRNKIGYVLKRFPRFSETFILNEILAHEAAGAEVHVFSLLDPPDEPRHARLSELKARITLLKPYAKGAAAAEASTDAAMFSGKSSHEVGRLKAKAAAVANIAAAQGIDHLHAHFGSDAATVALLAARRMNGSFSYTAHARDIYHTYVSPQADATMRSAKMREAAFVATVSDYNVRHLSSICPEANVVRIYNGVDLGQFRPDPSAPKTPGRLLAVGRFVPKKGFDVLLEASALLMQRGADFHLSMVGTGPLESTLRDAVDSLGLQDFVRFEGPLPQQDLVRHMAGCEAVVLPCIVAESGDRDGLPTVLLEAMAMGLPAVTTTVSGGPEIVQDGVTGRLCVPGEPPALANALDDVLSDPARALRMGQAGRIRAERLFDLKTNAASLRRLLAKPDLASAPEAA